MAGPLRQPAIMTLEEGQMMFRTKRAARALATNRRGATAIEYALVASLISVAAIVGFNNLGSKVDGKYQAINASL